MKVEGHHDAAAPRRTVWEAILDPEVIRAAIPGCQTLERRDAFGYAARLRVVVGPVRAGFEGLAELRDVDPPNGYRFELRAKGVPGFVEGQGRVLLTDADGGATRVSYDVEVRIGGKLAAIGQRLLANAAEKLVRRSLAAVEREIAGRTGGGGVQGAP